MIDRDWIDEKVPTGYLASDASRAKLAGDINSHVKAEIRKSHKGRVPMLTNLFKKRVVQGLIIFIALCLWTYASVVVWLHFESMP